MWILLFFGGVVCAFGVLSVVSNERAARVRKLEDVIRAQAEAQAEEADEIPVVGSPVPNAAVHVPLEEPILVR